MSKLSFPSSERYQVSITAMILVQFRHTPSSARIAQIEEVISNRLQQPIVSPPERYHRLVSADEAKVVAEVSEDGNLHIVELGSWYPGEHPSTRGRLFVIDYLTRYWETTYADGPMMMYALTMLCLLAQTDVNHVWYLHTYEIEGAKFPCKSRNDVHLWIDDYVRIGNMKDGRQAKYIRADDSDTIVEV
jgi:hypothetical protein